MRSTENIWPDNITDAKAVQLNLVKKVRLVPLRKGPAIIAGIDAAFMDDKIIAVACLFAYPGITLIERAHVVRNVTFPYIPGYLSFREGPAIPDLLRKLKNKPDLIIFDGQGIAHPKKFGLASHIGVLLDIPSIGCAKSRLVGQFREPGAKKGNSTLLSYKGEQVGTVLRTRTNVKPVFISPGNKIDFDDSVRIVMNCTTKYRLPEPVRCADIFSKEVKKKRSVVQR
ncbi:MAG: deoxyribonuclease V [Thermodesulfovibrionales bacterium]